MEGDAEAVGVVGAGGGLQAEGEALGVAVFAADADFSAAGDRVPG